MGSKKVLATAALVALPASVSAQIWIGQVVGQMAASQRQAALEQACRAGTPASPKNIAWATTSSQAAMDAYVTLTPKSGDGQLRKAFAMNKADVSWKGPDGASVPVTQLASHLENAEPKLKPIAFVVGGDAATARGIWEARWPEQSDRVAYYAVDFAGGPKNMWGGGAFHIWHFTVFPGDKQPATPAAYCHYDPDQAW